MSELICPFLPRESWYDEFEGPCAVMKGDYCKVYQQLVERDNLIAKLEAECDQLRKALQEIKHVPCRKEGGMYDSDGDWYVNECSTCRRMHDIAREALKGAGE